MQGEQSDCQYHPDLPKYKHLTEKINLEICEQVGFLKVFERNYPVYSRLGR